MTTLAEFLRQLEGLDQADVQAVVDHGQKIRNAHRAAQKQRARVKAANYAPVCFACDGDGGYQYIDAEKLPIELRARWHNPTEEIRPLQHDVHDYLTTHARTWGWAECKQCNVKG